MKKIILLISIIVCNVVFINGQIFDIERYTFIHDAEITSAVPYNDKFYCLDKNKRILYIDTENKLHPTDIINPEFYNLHIEDDSIYIIGRNLERYRLDGENFELMDTKYTGYERRNSFLYEDDDFRVEGVCGGEWGGTLYFTDKKTNKKYECEAMCPINVHKLNGTYVVTASLSHMSGWTEIFEIKNPRKMKRHKEDKNQKYINIADYCRSRKGKETILKGWDMIAWYSFIHDNTLYHIIENNPVLSFQTMEDFYLSVYKIENNTLKEEARLITGELRFYHNNVKTNNSQTAIFGSLDGCKSGFVHTKRNNIKIYTFEL